MVNESFTLLIAAISLIGGIIIGVKTPWIIRVSKQELKYLASFRCDNPKSCGNGAVCNSCWIRRWAVDKLALHFKKWNMIKNHHHE